VAKKAICQRKHHRVWCSCIFVLLEWDKRWEVLEKFGVLGSWKDGKSWSEQAVDILKFMISCSSSHQSLLQLLITTSNRTKLPKLHKTSRTCQNHSHHSLKLSSQLSQIKPSSQPLSQPSKNLHSRLTTRIDKLKLKLNTKSFLSRYTNFVLCFFMLPSPVSCCVFLLLSVNESSVWVWRFFILSWILIHWFWTERVFCRVFHCLVFFLFVAFVTEMRSTWVVWLWSGESVEKCHPQNEIVVEEEK
jgi:hypothetical protein